MSLLDNYIRDQAEQAAHYSKLNPNTWSGHIELSLFLKDDKLSVQSIGCKQTFNFLNKMIARDKLVVIKFDALKNHNKKCPTLESSFPKYEKVKQKINELIKISYKSYGHNYYI